MRTEEQKQIRKEQDDIIKNEYKIFYESNQFTFLQKCRKCSEVKILSEFLNNAFHKNICKECHKKKAYQWRNDNPEYSKRIWKEKYNIMRAVVLEHKLGKPCLKCNQSYPPCAMDFNHLDRSTKYKNVSKLELYAKDKDIIIREIAKCELICANCHRDETQNKGHEIDVFKNRPIPAPIVEIPVSINSVIKHCAKCSLDKNEENFTLLKTGYRHSYCKSCLRELNRMFAQDRGPRVSKEFIKEAKDNKPCMDCNVPFRYWVMDFDHRYDKTFSINTIQNRGIELIKAEIAKCDLICANCHRIRTEKRKINENLSVLDSLVQFIESLNLEFELGHSIQNHSYDIYIPATKLLIDLRLFGSGHSPAKRNEDVRKSQIARSSGYQFLSIFEDEWVSKSEAFKAIITNKVRLNNPIKLRPSKCEVVRPSLYEANELYERCHYIGKCKSNIHYGLRFENKLIACVSFARPTRQSKHEWELIRMVADTNYRIHGAWSKILGLFINEYDPKSIISFSDNRIFDGHTYGKLGFMFDDDVPVNYYWTKNGARYHKSGLRKPKGELRTETVIRTEQGYERIWDIGKKRWLMEL